MRNIILLLTLFFSSTTYTQEFGTNDHRISDMGTNGVTSFFAFEPRIAYSATNDNYLVVWNADDDSGSLVDNEFEIYGQFIDANGNEIGTNDFRISFNNADGDVNFRTDRPDIAWNSNTNQFLVVWEGETSIDGEKEVFGQIINGNGTLSGTNFRISDVGPEGDTNFAASRTEVIYNATNNEYLVVWEADDVINNSIEIYGQRISANGVEIGNNDFQISMQLPINDPNFDAKDSDVSWNSTTNEYLIVWQGETSVDNEREIFGQFFDGNTNSLSGSNFRISDMGNEGNTNFEGLRPKLTYNGANNEYLVVWQGDDVSNGEYEVYGQRLSASGTEIGVNDFRISTVTTINSGYDITRPEVIYNSTNNEYFVVYKRDSSVDNEFEIYGQLIDHEGILNGSSFVLSDMGPPGNTSFSADDCIVATNGVSDYIIAWEGDDNIAPLVQNEQEIFIQMFKNETLSTQESIAASRIIMFPNPTKDFLTLKGIKHNEKVVIYNIIGSKVMTKTMLNTEKLNIKELDSGLYFIQFENNATLKFIKK